MPRTAGHIIAPPMPITARHRDQHLDVRREPAEHREHGEDRAADHEDALAAEQVGEPPTGHDEHAEDAACTR